MEKLYRGPYIDAYCQVWFHLEIDVKLNRKHVQHVKTYLACNFKVNLITHLEVIAHFSSNFQNVNTFHPLFQFKFKKNKIKKGQ
jgi:hypothetical protein